MRLWLAAVPVVVWLAACDGDKRPHEPGGLAGAGGTSPIVDAGDDHDADAEAGGPVDAGDAGLTPVLIGITPSPRGDGTGGPTKRDEVEAALTTFAAGVRVAVLSATQRDLAGAGKDEIAAEVDFDHDHGLQVMLEVNIVDRAADGRPDELVMLPWDDASNVAALDATIDGVLLAFGAQLSFVSFGRDVDVYLAAHPAERTAFEAVAAHACTFARMHPAAPMGLKVGVGFSFEGASAPDPSFQLLLGASDLAAVSYLPGLGGSAPPPVNVASDLDALIGQVADKPIAMTRVGAPSSEAVGSSPEQQQMFYEGFFGALATRRASFVLVDVFELHDPSAAACADLATQQGEPPSGPFTDYACTLGVFGVGATAKPAWTQVLQGTAKFASP